MDISKERTPNIEAPEITFKRVFDNLDKTAEFNTEELPPQLARSVLESYGADFKRLSPEGKDGLSKYKRKRKKTGLKEVWGDTFYANTIKWIEQWSEDYESDPENRRLPRLTKSGVNYGGMVQFIGELTAYAAGELSAEDYKRYSEARVKNGQAWANNEERIRIKVPTAKKPILLASIPPGFVTDASKYILQSGL